MWVQYIVTGTVYLYFEEELGAEEEEAEEEKKKQKTKKTRSCGLA